MIVIIFLLFLQISFVFHILFLVQYVLKGDNKYLKRFINTAISNILIAGVLIITAIYLPAQVRAVNIRVMSWLFSGLIMIIMLIIKISIFKLLYRRSKDPEHFHYNFFGKKVLHPSVIKPAETMIFMFTIPFFLIAGSYFIARLINIILYKHL